ncbi:hypothetical protein MKW94_001414, partial [Papaver nudicaule]|nr:hypothetical protein [Papaver nudicaule]
MANDGNVNNSFRHLDLGKFPPWQLTVTLAGGEKRQIKIPYSEGDHVVGLPLGLDVPEVIAKNYKDLLCMVNGMTYIISNLTRKLDRQQQDAARYLEDANRYRLELQEVKCKIGSGMAVLQEVMTSISPSKKRKLRKEEYVPCETTTVSISEPEHLPSTRSSDTPAIPVLLVQESATEDNMNDLPLASVKRPRVEDISAGTSVDIPQVQTEMVLESIAGIGLIREPVDAMMTSSSANCLTVVDSTTLTTLTKKVIKSS